MKKVLLLLLIVMLAGCAADQGWKAAYEQEREMRMSQEGRIASLEARQRQAQQQPRQQPAAPQQPSRVTLAELQQKCQQLDKDQGTPVGCGMNKLDDGSPYIL